MKHFLLKESDIYEHFELVKSIDGALEQYHYYTDLSEDESIKTDIFIESKNGKIETFQIDTFNRFIETVNWDGLFLSLIETFSIKERKLNQNEEISKTYIDIIALPYDTKNFDLAIICSRSYKQFLRKKAVIAVRFEFFKNELKSFERKTDTAEPINHIKILEKHCLEADKYGGGFESWDHYYFPFIERYLSKLNKEEITTLFQKIFEWNDVILSRMAMLVLTYHNPYLENKNNYIYCKAFSLINNTEELENLIDDVWINEDELAIWETELLQGIKEKALLLSDSSNPMLYNKTKELIITIDLEFKRRNQIDWLDNF